MKDDDKKNRYKKLPGAASPGSSFLRRRKMYGNTSGPRMGLEWDGAAGLLSFAFLLHPVDIRALKIQFLTAEKRSAPYS